MSDSFRVTPLDGAIDVPTPLEDASGALIHVPRLSNRERDENYRAVIASLDEKRRVISCKDGLQWIIQRKRGDQWQGYSFHRCRDVLIERSGAKGDALAALQALPEWHP